MNLVPYTMLVVAAVLPKLRRTGIQGLFCAWSARNRLVGVLRRDGATACCCRSGVDLLCASMMLALH
jgi:hypothetical protein